VRRVTAPSGEKPRPQRDSKPRFTSMADIWSSRSAQQVRQLAGSGFDGPHLLGDIIEDSHHPRTFGRADGSANTSSPPTGPERGFCGYRIETSQCGISHPAIGRCGSRRRIRENDCGTWGGIEVESLRRGRGDHRIDESRILGRWRPWRKSEIPFSNEVIARE